MDFQMKYSITKRYLTPGTKRRSGKEITSGVKFIVAHDTGNPGSTAAQNVTHYENTRDEISASAHIFVDDNEIIECIPALTGNPEKAWHVLYNVATDNKLFGYDANDAAIGVEYCYGGRIRADEAYKMYVWVMAYICSSFRLDPATSIVGHCFLDPQRRRDPVTGLLQSRRTYDQLLKDVVSEYDRCTGMSGAGYSIRAGSGVVTVTYRLNIRGGEPNRTVPIVNTVGPGTRLDYVGWTDKGERVNNISMWYVNAQGNFFWSGAVV